MLVLVSAAARHDATWEIACTIGRTLAGHGLATDVRRPEDVADVAPYDAVVLGSALAAGRWLAPARELAEQEAPRLAERPVWLFSSGRPRPPSRTPAGEPSELERLVALTGARGHVVLPGTLERAPRRGLHDWSAVEEYAVVIAGQLAVTALAAASPTPPGQPARRRRARAPARL